MKVVAPRATLAPPRSSNRTAAATLKVAFMQVAACALIVDGVSLFTNASKAVLAARNKYQCGRPLSAGVGNLRPFRATFSVFLMTS